MDFVSINLPEKINRVDSLLEPGLSHTPNAHQGGEKNITENYVSKPDC